MNNNKIYIVNIFDYGGKILEFIDYSLLTNTPFVFKDKQKAQEFFDEITKDINIITNFAEKLTKTKTRVEYTFSSIDD